MMIVVPTVYCEVLITQGFRTEEKKYAPGEIAELPYGLALYLKAIGFAGAIIDELQKHAEAAESLKVYGGDSWFSPDKQTISRMAEYLKPRTGKDEDHGRQEPGDTAEEARPD